MADVKFPPTGPPRMTEAEIADLARRVVTNEVYLTNSAEAYKYAFLLVLMRLAEEDGFWEFAEHVGAVHAPWSSAGPRSINGFPFMTSVAFVHTDDLAPLIDKIEEMQRALGIPTQTIGGTE